jgi:hypothetical protein
MAGSNDTGLLAARTGPRAETDIAGERSALEPRAPRQRRFSWQLGFWTDLFFLKPAVEAREANRAKQVLAENQKSCYVGRITKSRLLPHATNWRSGCRDKIFIPWNRDNLLKSPDSHE